MLDPRSWQHYCPKVPEGKKSYFDHDCGGGRTLIVSNDDAGYSAYCFRCVDSGFMKHPELSLPEKLARLSRLAEADAAVKANSFEVVLPSGLNMNASSWPRYAALWLYKVGLGSVEIQRLGIGYSEEMDRVVIPVYSNGKLVYWQARGFTSGRPKYINPDVDKSKVLPMYGAGDFVVLTEDLLSAIKVGNVAQTLCLMGTSLQDHHLAHLLLLRKPVAVWLDADKAGLNAKAKLMRRLTAVGLHCVYIVTERDPKLLFEEEITHELNKAWGTEGVLCSDTT